MTEPQEIHRLDQLGAEIREMAHLVAVYYRALREEGVGLEIALDLTGRYQTGLVFVMLGIEEEDEEE